ncbi:molybdopterin synthase sulfur carrier subunit [Vibrio mangrovi]|uniref:Molybdopterin synthase sulfur carrier subunit n=1 Tax=Vibrio mangrovi TaxID=474394 RepID=A0A1Y6IQ06_9VIBR|nr:molybdopterin synthase sulfur carrier subunit [Vibrio mangrovi]MDW6003484.1 molybdopterin synthase sulfur carrier subunit [Vibrio mangrovi]SMR99724.1 Molybdopterin synthase sulfur carrier subunit [Vibrio mangrovi]
MIKVLFFAQTREIVGQDDIELPCTFATIDELRGELAARSEKWALAMNSDRLLAAVNQTIVSLDTAIQDGDEIAFFPPVTGG